MPGHDQTDVHCRRRAPAWLLCVASCWLLALPRGEVHGQTQISAAWKGSEAVVVGRRADRIQVWDDHGDRWLLLEGQAEASQGDVALTASSMVARIVRSGRKSGPVYRIDLYAEKDVRDPGQPDVTLPPVRTLLTAADGLQIQTLQGSDPERLKQRPKGLPILSRAFPLDDSTDTSRLAPAADLADGTTPAASVVPTVAFEQSPAAPQAPARRPDDAPAYSDTPIRSAESKTDNSVKPTQAVGSGPGFPDDFSAPPLSDPGQVPDPLPQDPAARGIVPNIEPFGPGADPLLIDPPTTLLPLPDGRPQAEAPVAGPPASGDAANVIVMPGSQRIIEIRTGSLTSIKMLDRLPDGTQTVVLRNKVGITTQTPEQGIIDLEAENIIIWIRSKQDAAPIQLDINNRITTKSNQPIEFYLEGNVVVRQDQQRIQGKSDQRTYKAERAYYDLQQERMLIINAELDLFAPGLITPMKIKSPRIFQYHPVVTGPDGQPGLSKLSMIQAEQSVSTGSRFANPGYRFTSRSIDITQVIDSQARPNESGLPYDQNDLTWQIDARQNFFYFGRVPVFYWPRFFVEADDLDPPLQGISFATNNYFGQQIRTDFDLFNIFNIRHVPEIDVANLSLD